jgi:hypothetical protein
VTCEFWLNTGRQLRLILQADPHSHPEDDTFIRREEVVASMRTKICENPTRPVRRVYDESIVLGSSSDDDDDVIESTPQFSEVKASLNRYRGNFYPAIPRSFRDVFVRGEWKRTWSHKPFLVHQDSRSGLLIFMSEACAVC